MKKIVFLIVTIAFVASIQAQKIGDSIPEINLPNTEGTKVSIQGLRGKVVILDFWASWCGPCKEVNKGLKKIYKKYKEKGVEIYSLSIDDNQDKWKAAIKKQGLTWLQVIDPGGWDSPTAKKWNISAVPTSFVIDKKGKIQAIDLEGKELQKKLDELLK